MPLELWRIKAMSSSAFLNPYRSHLGLTPQVSDEEKELCR